MMRDCMVKGTPAKFHCWTTESQIVEPSPMIGGHNGGVVSTTFGVVEYENGTVGLAHPSSIVFTDKEAE